MRPNIHRQNGSAMLLPSALYRALSDVLRFLPVLSV
jgi:hypothetical protein